MTATLWTASTQRHYSLFDTAAGACGIAWTGGGVCRFQLPARSADATERFLLRHAGDAQRTPVPPSMTAVIDAVTGYFGGKPMDFRSAILDLSDQDASFQRIYCVARNIPWGGTSTYGAIARELNLGPEGARNVGRAMALNPVPLIIPCHRVLAANGKLGGFSAPGGVSSKLRMLALEGYQTPPSQGAQQSLAL